ncbi:helix-turn-helix domain-containing protein [Levilactobacillus wangkuiensis]|uniref:helix-turn-helix domain-containing protein n=1 Tax=Levilactobacillus wangkuiensis TaxID=2799566 RepID=UPI0019426D87|nr:helix-turn-helix transcriptional regulator [Levilactobacillus wangkuiensis]
MTTFERIKEVANKRGWNLQTVAKKSGMGANSIYKWKNQTPKLDKLAQVAKTLDVSVEYLLGTEQQSSTAPKEIDLKETIDNMDIVKTYDGKIIPAEDLALIKRLMRGE